VLPGLVIEQPQTNVVPPNSITWYTVKVPARADLASNFLLFATAPLNLWYSRHLPPTITNGTDAELLTNALSGVSVLDTTSPPVLVPGKRYSLGLQNTNSFAVTNAVMVTFDIVPLPNFPMFVTPTNFGGTNGYLVTWFAPTNDQFHLQWTPTLSPMNWANFNGVVSVWSFLTPTNSRFQYFDDGTQSGGFGPTRFYRLLLLDSPTNTAPYFLFAPGITNAPPSMPFAFANPAADWDVPPQTLTYTVANSLAATNVTISQTTGVISWTPDPSLLGQTNLIVTIVTDNGVPPKSVANILTVVVSTNLVSTPLPPLFSSVSLGTNGLKFVWSAPTNEQFQIRWTTNLSPAVWHLFPGTNTSATGNFIYVDTNTLMMMKFYQLILLP
jgi:hypothetical protein